jgi:anti-sigma factor RsiW
MLSTDSSSSCGRGETLRDYAFDELPAGERAGMEQHLSKCGECAQELDRLRLTSAALRLLPDKEIPQRIAFVSDKVFEPSWFARFWNSGARMGFASACVLALAMVVSAWHVAGAAKPAREIRTVVQTAASVGNQEQIDNAVAQAVAKVRADEARMIQTAVEASERKQDQQFFNQVVALQERFDVLKKKLNYSYASMASSDSGPGQ